MSANPLEEKFYYKLIKEYPGSPEIGKVLKATMSEFYSVKPDKYPGLWKKCKYDESFATKNGEMVTVGDVYWFIDDYFTVRYGTFSNPYYIPSFETYSTKELAEAELIKKINVKTESGIIEAEDVKLYGLLAAKNQLVWQQMEMSSLDMFRRNNTGRKLSDGWKFFTNKEARDSYEYLNKPVVSRKALLPIIDLIAIGTKKSGLMDYINNLIENKNESKE